MFTYSEKHDVGWLHGVLIRQTNQPVVDASLEVRLGGPSDREMPLERLIFQWLCIDKDLLARPDVLEFFHYAAHCQ